MARPALGDSGTERQAGVVIQTLELLQDRCGGTV